MPTISLGDYSQRVPHVASARDTDMRVSVPGQPSACLLQAQPIEQFGSWQLEGGGPGGSRWQVDM